MTGFQLIGYEYGVELTFPECDSYVAGILNISGYFFGIMLTLLIQKLQTTFTILFGNLVKKIDWEMRDNFYDFLLSYLKKFENF